MEVGLVMPGCVIRRGRPSNRLALSPAFAAYCADEMMRTFWNLARKVFNGAAEMGDQEKTEVLGRVGTVTHIYYDGDIKVNFRNGRSWCFNPDLAEAVSDDESESSDSDSEVPDALQRMMRDLFGIHTTGDGMVRKLQLTPFLVACHQGDESFVMASITTGANVNEKNNHGDTALHFGAYGQVIVLNLFFENWRVRRNACDKPAILELLVNLGADINAKNKKGYTALHVAVNKDSVACVRVLTNYISDLNVNTQDEYGDTPLHDAIRKANNDIVDLLVNFRSIDFTVKNKRGFNVVELWLIEDKEGDLAVRLLRVAVSTFICPWFALHRDTGGSAGTQPYLMLHTPTGSRSSSSDALSPIATPVHRFSRRLIDLAPEFTPSTEPRKCRLPLQMANASPQPAPQGPPPTQPSQGRCMVDLKNVKGETALLLAVHNGHCELAELLVEAGADINKPDEDGNTPMHMILLRLQKIKVRSIGSSKAPIVSDVTSSETNLSLACFLANKGGDLYKKNKAGKTPLDVAGGTKFVEWLLRSKMAPRAKATSSSEQSSGGATASAASEDGKCKMCCDAPASVWFEPCGHRLYCPDCCRRMKCCLSCGERITGKVSDGERPADNESQQRELEARLRRLEEAHTCIICMERERNVAFMCGHVACDRCAANLSDCHICRNPIDKRITLF
ncbi:hypothetical protein HPB51_014419 [Rhipicephalus microplus]|uniref:RING-type E3 ubiquitin transferase n=1 Tax=Rhipicephalus microplus TaxID=6941 RepID=A0A9J6F446_RHIMP|nr:hypothetical protein HPB51_014419 [Rhipicephalus microplus]